PPFLPPSPPPPPSPDLPLPAHCTTPPTLPYNLLVGGMLIPLIGAIYWKRATTAGAITSMTLGFLTVLVFMIKDGLDANTPIYYSLAVGLLSFVLVSLFSRRPTGVASAA
ncbi:hypothetical protein VST35_29955, partial [Pseudomonas aeruginosa]